MSKFGLKLFLFKKKHEVGTRFGGFTFYNYFIILLECGIFHIVSLDMLPVLITGRLFQTVYVMEPDVPPGGQTMMSGGPKGSLLGSLGAALKGSSILGEPHFRGDKEVR